MHRVNTRDFKAHSGKYTDMALVEPVIIQKHNRDSVVLISCNAYKTFEAMKEELEDLKLVAKIKKIKESNDYIGGEEAINRLKQMANYEE